MLPGDVCTSLRHWPCRHRSVDRSFRDAEIRLYAFPDNPLPAGDLTPVGAVFLAGFELLLLFFWPWPPHVVGHLIDSALDQGGNLAAPCCGEALD
jgi:hypothetical protein